MFVLQVMIRKSMLSSTLEILKFLSTLNCLWVLEMISALYLQQLLYLGK